MVDAEYLTLSRLLDTAEFVLRPVCPLLPGQLLGEGISVLSARSHEGKPSPWESLICFPRCSGKVLTGKWQRMSLSKRPQDWSKIRPVSVQLWETSVPGAHLEDTASHTQPSWYTDFNA